MNTRSESHLFAEKLAWENPSPGITRQIMGYDDQIMMVKVRFEKGAVGAPHTHFHSQVTYVASGKFEFEIGGKKSVVGPGDGCYMEPDELHSCVCLEAGDLIDVFTPHRADFLAK